MLRLHPAPSAGHCDQSDTLISLLLSFSFPKETYLHDPCLKVGATLPNGIRQILDS